MKDYLVRGMTMDGFVKVVAIRSTQIVSRAAEIHKTTPNATAALGRALTAASMMGNMQKVENGSMTLQIRGGGPIGTITVVSDPEGNVRGCVTEPRVPLQEKFPGKLDVGATVGTDGTLTVIRDLQMKEPYIGSTPLVSGEIGDDVTAYFAQSEQTPTACALGVLVDRDQSVKVAGGYLVQLLPGAPDEVIDTLEAGIQRAGAVTKMLEEGLTPEDILGQVCGSLGVVFMETTEVSYKCYCTRQRVESALISLGRKELEEIRDEGKTFPVECQFCDTVYAFTPADMDELLKKI
ncbi:MAG: Hsp33 family molecular chaperone HslO [Oscillospiraceae bacterium]|nr:Hsp33 family molecular chaperone HslO [Oscillospiraceae bacterium]MBQ7129677.1 Hsp33 family molecular chaperone HslO [Oscillospiraceae bacterium]